VGTHWYCSRPGTYSRPGLFSSFVLHLEEVTSIFMKANISSDQNYISRDGSYLTWLTKFIDITSQIERLLWRKEMPPLWNIIIMATMTCVQKNNTHSYIVFSSKI